MIIGTAGHIDHGKSTLVHALTGVTMDRLREEQQRGITIDLNFAPYTLPDGSHAGVVDVPGHEDFIRTMVAGASGIDLVLLVIAADEGIMPQTREHLAIIEQLGVRHGIPVLTKSDLVESEWLELLGLEIAEWLAHSPCLFEEPIAVSATSGMGVEALRETISRFAGGVNGRTADDQFRLPIDRAFSVAGIGTVVTGTAWSGAISHGDQVSIMPGARTARVRSIEMHGREVNQSAPAMRVALGLAGIDRADLRRGDVVTDARDSWQATGLLDVDVTLASDAPKALAQRSRVRLLLGTAEVIARVSPLERIAPGSSGMARLTLEAPLLARGADRFVLRSLTPVRTIGGGRVLDPAPPRRKAIWPAALRASSDLERIEALAGRRQDGVASQDLPFLSGLTHAEIATALEAQHGLRLAGSHWLPRATVAGTRDEILSMLSRFHEGRPQDAGMPLGELRQIATGSAWRIDAALDDLTRAGRLIRDEALVRLASFTPKADARVEIDRVVAAIQKGGLTPPSSAELSESLGISDVGPILRVAVKEKLVEPVERDRHYAAAQLEVFVEVLRELGAGGEITPGRVRDRLGISRKYLIPLLEWSDSKGVTSRVGEGRILRPSRT